jgi:carbonic anhydrase
MSKYLQHLLDNNKTWALQIKAAQPDFFQKLSQQQSPEYLWIGCSDSRVPANEIIGLLPGEVFVHRNVANIVVHTDLNCLSVIQYAVEVLQVKHIIVCGHYGCGGVRAAMGNNELGLIDNWLRHIKDTYQKHEHRLSRITDDNVRLSKLCELNVVEQVYNVCYTTIVQNAWKRGQPLTVNGWLYSLQDGLIRDLNISVSSREEISSIYHIAAEPSGV